MVGHGNTGRDSEVEAQLEFGRRMPLSGSSVEAAGIKPCIAGLKQNLQSVVLCADGNSAAIN